MMNKSGQGSIADTLTFPFNFLHGQVGRTSKMKNKQNNETNRLMREYLEKKLKEENDK